MKYSRVHRLLKIITLIQSGGRWDARALARECGTTERTVYRDLNMLEGAGVPYYLDEETGGYRIRREFFMPPVELTLEEALALVCLGEHVGEGEQIPLLEPAARAVAKVRGQLPAGITGPLEQVAPHVEIKLAASMPRDGVTDVYQLVRWAIGNRRALRCAYERPRGRSGREGQSPARTARGRAAEGDGELSIRPGDGGNGAEEDFLFRPYCLFFSQRAWYAIGRHSGRSGLRCLKLNRFTRMTQTDTPYAIPEDFSLKTYLGKAWRMIPGDRVYRVELHVDAEFAETVADTHWHDTQEVEWLDDGSILLRCEVAGLDEIVWWILGMGPHCTVRRPKMLGDRVRRLSRATSDNYAGSRHPDEGTGCRRAMGPCSREHGEGRQRRNLTTPDHASMGPRVRGAEWSGLIRRPRRRK